MIYRNIATWGFLSALLVSVVSNEGLAQGRQNPQFLPYSEVGFGAGTSTYFGDLAGYSAPFRSLTTLPRWNVGLMYTRHFTPRLSVRASFTWARITGDDYTFTKSDPVGYAAQYVRNLQFRNDLKEFALIGMYDFIPGGRTPRNRPKIAPYLLLGVALVAHNPVGLTGRNRPDGSAQQWVALQPLGTEGQGQPGYAKQYSLVTVSIPMGLGVRYALNESFNLAAEVRLTPTFSDYLDDVGGNYPSPNDLSTPLAKEFSNRSQELLATRSGDNRQAGIDKVIAAGGNPVSVQRGGAGRIPVKDSYLLTSFQIHYIIPAKIRCP